MKLQAYTYSIPFKKSFRTARSSFDKRQGIYVSLHKDSITALGEAAPVPGFSHYAIADLVNQLKNKYRAITHFFAAPYSLSQAMQFIESQNLAPSLQFCLYTLAATFLAQKKKLSLHNFLFDDCRVRISMNGVIGLEELTNINKIDQLIAHGYETIKIKADANGQSLVAAVKKINDRYPNLKIRIDANQSWTLQQAEKCLNELAVNNIEYCEEPLAKPNRNSLHQLRNAVEVPIALDESIGHTFTLRQAIESTPVIIIKPMVLGLEAVVNSLQKNAMQNGTKLVFTTGLESGVGRLMTATLAAGLGSPNASHGLDTGRLLARDIWTDGQFIAKGNFILPDANHLSALMNQEIGSLSIQEIFTQ